MVKPGGLDTAQVRHAVFFCEKMCVRSRTITATMHLSHHIPYSMSRLKGVFGMYGGTFGGYTRWAVVFLIIFVLFFLLVPTYTTTCTTTPVY